MSWISISEADVLTVLSGPELEAYRAAALANGQADPVQPTIDQVTDLVRGYVGASGRFVLGETGIPQKLKAPALDIIAYRIPSRVGQDPGQTRKDQQDEALHLLQQVADGKFVIEEPTTPSSEVNGSPSPSFGTVDRKFTAEDEDGI